MSDGRQAPATAHRTQRSIATCCDGTISGPAHKETADHGRRRPWASVFSSHVLANFARKPGVPDTALILNLAPLVCRELEEIDEYEETCAEPQQVTQALLSGLQYWPGSIGVAFRW